MIFASVLDSTLAMVEGTGDGEYSIDVQGSTPGKGVVNDSITGTISDGETHTLTATIPDDSNDEGVIVSSDHNPDDDSPLFGLSETELAAGGVVSVAMAYAAVQMLHDDDEEGIEGKF